MLPQGFRTLLAVAVRFTAVNLALSSCGRIAASHLLKKWPLAQWLYQAPSQVVKLTKVMKLRQVPMERAVYGSLLDADMHHGSTQGVVQFA